MPNNATVVVVGDVDAARARDMVEKHFGGIAAGTLPSPVVSVEPPQQGERRFKLRKPGDTRYLMAAYPNPALTHEDNYALDVLGMILGHGKTSRLYQGLVEGTLATDAEAQNETARDPFLFIVQATAAPGVELQALEEALFAQVERLQNEPPAPAEMARAGKQLQASFIYARDSIRSLAQQLGYYETVGSYRYLDTYLERIAGVTREDVRRVALAYLGESTRTVGQYEPTHE
jgi:zinc protease